MAMVVRAPYKVDQSDNFNRANGGLGSSWTGWNFGGQSGVGPAISSNVMAWGATTNNNTNTKQGATWNTALNTTDQIVQGKFVTDWSNALVNGCLVRCTSTFTKGVAMYTHDANVYIDTYASATWTNRYNASHSGWNINDILQVRVIGNLYIFVANPDTSPVIKGSWQDTSNVYPVDNTMRYGGLMGNSDCNIFGAQGFAPFMDDFRIRDY